jgi:AcrR family transcriptional regulator
MAERTGPVLPARRVRRRRDPSGTREAILEAARQELALDGQEGVSVAQVAVRAGVNRGTAYQHFQTREQLIEATAASVSDQLYAAVFGPDDADPGQTPVEGLSIEAITRHLAEFAMENPELGRVWLFELLSSRRPVNDRFWQRYLSNFEQFAKTEFAQPGVDAEVVTVLSIAGAFLWPVWVRSRARNAKEREQLAGRFSREMLRLSLHGTLQPEKYRDLNQRVADADSTPTD